MISLDRLISSGSRTVADLNLSPVGAPTNRADLTDWLGGGSGSVPSPAEPPLTESTEGAGPAVGTQEAYTGPRNPGFRYRENANGTAFFSYQAPASAAAADWTRIRGDTATLPSGAQLTRSGAVPSWQQQIANVQGYIAEARQTQQSVEVGNVIYHVNGNIQYTNYGPNQYDDPKYQTKVESILAGLVDPQYERTMFGSA